MLAEPKLLFTISCQLVLPTARIFVRTMLAEVEGDSTGGRMLDVMRRKSWRMSKEVGGSIYPPNRKTGFVSFVHACMHAQRGTRCMRQSGLGCPASPPVDAAVGVDWAWPWVRPWARPWARFWAGCCMDTAAGAAVGRPNLAIPLRERDCERTA
jgi:hypothetical protein